MAMTRPERPTDCDHEPSWSAALEPPAAAAAEALVVEHAIGAVDRCGCGGTVARVQP